MLLLLVRQSLAPACRLVRLTTFVLPRICGAMTVSKAGNRGRGVCTESLPLRDMRSLSRVPSLRSVSYRSNVRQDGITKAKFADQ
ncbi:hypothetical protein EV356DRAFT_499754, partial [Viridothelium virens]